MNYLNRIAAMRNQAEAKFRNWDGYIAPKQQNYARTGYRRADGTVAAPAAQETLDPNNRTWTITATNNSSAAAATATIFGSVLDLTDTLNTAAGVTVTVAEATHIQVKTELLSQPVRIMGLKMVTQTAAQFSNVVYMYSLTSSGALDRRLFQPLNYRSAQNQLTTQIDAPNFELLVNSNLYIQFTINKAEIVTFTFTIAQKSNISATLRSAPVVSSSNIPAPTGLPQIDMPRGV
jgi:hypothetical protein